MKQQYGRITQHMLLTMTFLSAAAMAICLIIFLQSDMQVHVDPADADGQRGLQPEGWQPDVDTGEFPAVGLIQPSPINIADLPLAQDDPMMQNLVPIPPRDERPDMPISEYEADRLRQLAMQQPPQAGIQIMPMRGPQPTAPNIDRSFESLNFDDGGNSVPPDPEMAVGPEHVIATVNSMIEIYDHDGNTLLGPVSSNSFFSGVAGCSGTFDPNVLYDEKEDRFFIGYDSVSGPGTDNGYCMAVTAGNDPTATWNRYSFDASFNPGDFFDYPHAGIGDRAIFMGANIFGNTFRADVWAIDKFAMYNGDPLPMPVRHQLNTLGDNPDTPQPANLHGWMDGAWPEQDEHFIIAECFFNGSDICVYRWEDPFGADLFTRVGSFSLNAETGITGGFPLDVPQSGGSPMQGNDRRPQDAEYRNGFVYITQTISCNPGAGVVNCVRWAQLDPATANFVQGGVFASDGEFRSFPDLAVNACNDVLIGYTKSSPDMFPSVYFTGRISSDPVNTLRPEAELKAGEVPYSAFDSVPRRWGDYTGATSDPNGDLLWYLGEYSRDNAASTKWANMIGAFDTGCLTREMFFLDGFED